MFQGGGNNDDDEYDDDVFIIFRYHVGSRLLVDKRFRLQKMCQVQCQGQGQSCEKDKLDLFSCGAQGLDSLMFPHFSCEIGIAILTEPVTQLRRRVLKWSAPAHSVKKSGSWGLKPSAEAPGLVLKEGIPHLTSSNLPSDKTWWRQPVLSTVRSSSDFFYSERSSLAFLSCFTTSPKLHFLSLKWQVVGKGEGKRESSLMFKRMSSGINRPRTESWHCCILTLILEAGTPVSLFVKWK